MIHERLRHLRQTRNKQIQEIAKILNITGPAYSKIERGNTSLSPEKLSILSAYYQVSMNWIVDGKEFDPGKDFSTPEMISEPDYSNLYGNHTDFRKKLEDLEEDVKILKKIVARSDYQSR